LIIPPKSALVKREAKKETTKEGKKSENDEKDGKSANDALSF
jgi:hypothetical protein